MAIFRTEIEKALNEIIPNEEGMRFQGLAVIEDQMTNEDDAITRAGRSE